MKTVKFTKAFTIREDAATTTTYPEGWVGEVEDDIAELAAEEGCIEDKPKPKAEKPAKPKAEKPAAAAPDAPAAAADAGAPPV